MAGWQLLHVEAGPPFVLNKSTNHFKKTKMDKAILIAEIPFQSGDEKNLKNVIEASLSMLDDGEILTLPMKKQKKTVKIDGKWIQILESSVDISKKMRISKME